MAKFCRARNQRVSVNDKRRCLSKKEKEFHNSRLLKHPIPRLNKGGRHCVLCKRQFFGLISPSRDYNFQGPGEPGLPGLAPSPINDDQLWGMVTSAVWVMGILCAGVIYYPILWSGIPARTTSQRIIWFLTASCLSYIFPLLAMLSLYAILNNAIFILGDPVNTYIYQYQPETSTLFGLLFLRDWLCQLVMWLLEVYSILIFLFFTYFMEIKNWLTHIYLPPPHPVTMFAFKTGHTRLSHGHQIQGRTQN